MNAPATRFDRDTAVTRVAGGAFEATIDRGWWIHRGPNGGYVAAVLLRALTEAVGDPSRSARTFTTHFTSPPAAGPIRIETSIERSGRSLTTITGRMRQGDRLCATAIAAFSRPRGGPEFQDARMPEVPPPERGDPLSAEESSAPIRARYDYRSIASRLTGAEPGAAVGGGWIRLAEPRAADAPLVAALCDCWSPAIFHRRGPESEERRHGAPTIELTIHFRQGLPLADARPGDWYLTLFRTRTARDGFMEEDGEVFTREGLLVAQSRQLAAFL